MKRKEKASKARLLTAVECATLAVLWLSAGATLTGACTGRAGISALGALMPIAALLLACCAWEEVDGSGAGLNYKPIKK